MIVEEQHRKCTSMILKILDNKNTKAAFLYRENDAHSSVKNTQKLFMCLVVCHGEETA